ncbi:MAG: hypothetical protein ACFCUJ_01370 [Thiotrichales bacterium]
MISRLRNGKQPIGQLVFVWIPMLLAAFYWGYFASDRYVSESKFVMQRSGNAPTAGMDLAAMIGAGGSESRDSMILREYVLSHDMLDYLTATLQLRDHFSATSIDYLSRLDAQASREDYLEYYRKRISVEFDAASSMITLRVQAFNREMARRIVEAIVKQSERFTNVVGHQMAEEQMAFATGQLQRAQDQLRKVKQGMLSFQNEHNIVSPKGESEAVSSIIMGMEVELAGKKAELKTVTTFLNPTAPEVARLKAEIDSLDNQIRAERKKIVGSDVASPLNDLTVRFEEMQMNLEFGSDIYRSTLSALESARIDASRKLKHLVIVQSPNLPESAEYPRRFYNLVTFFAFVVMLYWIGRLAVATIKDHKD